MTKRSVPDWMSALPLDPSKLTLEELRVFKETYAWFQEPVEAPEVLQQFYGCFKFLTAYSALVYSEGRFAALNRCWDELTQVFLGEELFGDGIFIQSWMFCDFPIDGKDRTLLDECCDFLGESALAQRFQPFAAQLKKSRLGLHQEILSTKTDTKFRELVTGNVATTLRSVDVYEPGEVFLTRLVEYAGIVFQFGDPKCWPKEYRSELEDMVERKSFFFEGENENARYCRLMKLAGPYWFSCVTRQEEVDIFSPDHYRTYYDAKGEA